MIKKNEAETHYLLFFTLSACLIWIYDIKWLKAAEDTLPILVGFLLFIWLGSPWDLNCPSQKISKKNIFFPFLLAFLGITLNVLFFLALAWTLFFWEWLKPQLHKEKIDISRRLLIFLLLAFPWIHLDLERLGWWFRLSSAWSCAHLFSLTGFSVQQEGTQLMVNQLPISIDAACAGLNTLQSTLIAGSCANFLILGKSYLFWWNLPFLVLLSWISNTLRIIILTLLALFISPEAAKGSLHLWGGLAVLLLTFFLALSFFSLQNFYFLKRKS